LNSEGRRGVEALKENLLFKNNYFFLVNKGLFERMEFFSPILQK
jgi:hypothetical protein